MSEWLPIASAPKDGGWALLYYPEGAGWDFDSETHVPLMAVMRWDVEFGKRAGPEADYCWKGYYTGTEPEGKPTHWQPLPPPPAT